MPSEHNELTSTGGRHNPVSQESEASKNVLVPPLHVTKCEQSFRTHHITYSGLSQAVHFKEQMFLIEALCSQCSEA